jgi:hypothetical protein
MLTVLPSIAIGILSAVAVNYLFGDRGAGWFWTCANALAFVVTGNPWALFVALLCGFVTARTAPACNHYIDGEINALLRAYGYSVE